MLSWPMRMEKAAEIVQKRRFWFWTYEGKRGFTRDDRTLAEDWCTCPSGQADPRIERKWKPGEESGWPKDKQLRVLGEKFSDAVEDDDTDRALILYSKIQQRAMDLGEKLDKKAAKKQRKTEPVAC